MSVEIKVNIREYSDGSELPAVANAFIRRDWTAVHRASISLSSGVTTELETNISSYEFVYIKVSGGDTDVTLYLNSYPEIFGMEFDDTILVYGLEGVTKLRLKADADVTVSVFLAGS